MHYGKKVIYQLSWKTFSIKKGKVEIWIRGIPIYVGKLKNCITVYWFRCLDIAGFLLVKQSVIYFFSLVDRLETMVVDIGPPADWVKVNVQRTVCFSFVTCVT